MDLRNKITVEKERCPFIPILIIVFILSVLSLIGCNRNEQIGLHHESRHHLELEKEAPSGQLVGEEMKPLAAIPLGDFGKIVGWLNDESILYVADESSGSHLYRYYLYTGKSELLYDSDAPIAEVTISPSKDKILLHTAPSTHQGVITIIDRTGNQLSQHTIDSFELSFSWNQFNEDQLYVAAFHEDWTFETMLLEVNNNEITTLTISDPFVQWLAKDEIVYLNWDQDSPTLTAPLMRKELNDSGAKTISNNVIDFATYGGNLLYIKVGEQNRNIAEYTLLNKQQQQLSFEIPLLTRYSGWLVPYHDFSVDKQTFYSFRPLRSADADMYGDKFQLVAFDAKNDKKTVILENQENEPISISPNGRYLLCGFQLEKIIDLDTKRTTHIVH